MATNYNTRTEIDTTYTPRISKSWLVMNIIKTWFWDDLEDWEDNRFWVDEWGTTFGTLYTTRPVV